MTTENNFRYAAILTTYNSELTLQRAVDGILSQQISPHEVIIVDDCSRDNTIDLLNSSIFPTDNVIIKRNAENHGQSWSRNLAVSISNSDFIIVFDDDDVSLPERSVEHKKMFELGTQMNFVSSRKIYPSGRHVSLFNSDVFLKSVSGQDALLAVLSGEAIQEFKALAIPASTSAYSREFFNSVHGYDPEFRRLEDAELFVKFSYRNASFAWSSKECVHRTATFSTDKGGSTEMLYEFKLLEKYSGNHPDIQVRWISALIEMRAMYFDRKYLRLVYEVLFHSDKRRIFISKFQSAFLRVKHDWQTGFRR